MMNLDPETEAGSCHEDFADGSQNTSAISFNEVEEGKIGLGTDQEMFPNFEQAKTKE